MVSVFMVYHYNHLDYFTLEVRTDNFVVHFSSTILFLSFSFHRLYRNKIFRVIPSKKKKKKKKLEQLFFIITLQLK